MALHRFGSRVLGTAGKRLKSTLTLPQEVGRHGKEFGLTEGFTLDLSLTRTKRGLLVASLDNYAPVSRVVLAVNSGARFEAAHEQGAGHALRALGYLSTKDATSFGISRTLDVNGANSHVTSTREATLYGVDILRNKLAIELAHKAAFRTGLGRSIFCPTYALKKLNSDL